MGPLSATKRRSPLPATKLPGDCFAPDNGPSRVDKQTRSTPVAGAPARDPDAVAALAAASLHTGAAPAYCCPITISFGVAWMRA